MTMHLTHGNHKHRADGMCAMEAAAYIAGERHSDKPECVSPVLAAFMIGWNDGLPNDTERDRLLKPLLPLVLHTATGPVDDEIRAWMATDWLVRVHTPAWLELAKLPTHAAALRALPPFTCVEIAVATQATIKAAGEVAWEAAGAAAWEALAPTVAMLQASATELVKAMCAVGEVTERPMRAERLGEILATSPESPE